MCLTSNEGVPPPFRMESFLWYELPCIWKKNENDTSKSEGIDSYCIEYKMFIH
jgi:hypothetical protein